MIDLLHHAALFFTGMAAVAHGPAKPKDTDAGLIALCDEACEIHAGSVQIEHEHEAQGLPVPHETIIWPRTAKWHELCDTITDTPAETLEGMRAKARVLLDVIAMEEPMVASLCADLLGRDAT